MPIFVYFEDLLQVYIKLIEMYITYINRTLNLHLPQSDWRKLDVNDVQDGLEVVVHELGTATMVHYIYVVVH